MGDAPGARRPQARLPGSRGLTNRRALLKSIGPLRFGNGRECTFPASLAEATGGDYDWLMGCSGIAFDMSSSPDTVQTLCMVAAMAGTATTITGISHLKFKESDRINGTADRLRALGGDVSVDKGSITIRPALLHGGTIDPANDHRTAMSFAVLGLGMGGISITNTECADKSFPGFFGMLEHAGLLP